ncbi:MAG TPA: hypothetical protein VMW80_02060 [Candidatus Dormibacteraeota bacterium]|nr:hypothetical protein [Candidatus Dormibacteraeota bacterium]
MTWISMPDSSRSLDPSSGWAGEHAVAGEEIIDLAHHLDAASRDEHEIVGNP